MATDTICFGRNVHEVDFGRRHVAIRWCTEEASLRALARSRGCGLGERRTSTVVAKVPSLQRRVGLGDDVVLFLVGGEVDDCVGDLAVLDLAVRRLDEAEGVDTVA